MVRSLDGDPCEDTYIAGRCCKSSFNIAGYGVEGMSDVALHRQGVGWCMEVYTWEYTEKVAIVLGAVFDCMVRYLQLVIWYHAIIVTV